MSTRLLVVMSGRHRKLLRFLCLLLLFKLLTPAVALAQAVAGTGVMFGATGRQGENPGSLLTLDLETGAGTLVGASGLPRLTAIAVNSRGEIFAIPDSRELYQIDAETGAATLKLSAVPSSIRAIAFDSNDVLFGVRFSRLITIDLQSGGVTEIGFTGFSFDNLAFDPTDGRLWAAASEHLYIVDTTDGSISVAGSTSPALDVEGLSFDSEGNLYASVVTDTDENLLVSIDKVTGAASTIGEIGFSSIAALALRPDSLTQAQLGLSAKTIDFGTVPVNGSVHGRKVLFRNIGTENLTVSAISMSAADFTLDGQPSLPLTLAPGEGDSLTVSFAPSDSGKFSDTIRFTSDDADTPGKEIAVLGRGLRLTPATAGVCYAVTGQGSATSTSLFTIDSETGAGTLVGATGLESLSAIAVDSSGTLLGLGGSNSDLYFIDAATGEVALATPTDFFSVSGMAFDGKDRLFVASRDAIYQVDVASGAPTLVGFAGIAVSGMAFDPIDGVLWASGGSFSSPRTILNIDVTTGQPTIIGSVHLDGGVTALHFDSDGNLFGALSTGSDSRASLIAIDKVTAEGFVVGDTGFNGVTGMTLLPQKRSGPQIGLSTQAIDFGFTLIDSTSAAKKVFLANTGSEDLNISDIAVSEGPFALSRVPDLPVMLAPGASDSIALVFTPPDSGRISGAVTITSTDADDPTSVVRLAGDGLFLNPAQDGVSYVGSFGTFSDPGDLLSMDLTTGATTLVGVTGLEDVSSLAIRPSGIILASDRTENLYYVDGVTGETTLAARTELFRIDQLAFAASDTLFATRGRDLYTIDVQTGKSTMLGSMGTFLNGLVFDPLDQRLWGVTSGGTLLTIDPETAKTTVVSTIPTQGRWVDVQFDSEGSLFGVQSEDFTGEDALFAIEKETGQAALVGQTGRTDLASMAIRTTQLSGPQLSFSTPGANFGLVAIGDHSLPATVTFRNVGTEDLTVTSITLAEGDFTLNRAPELPLNMGAGASETIELLFSPTTSGDLNTSLVVASNDADEPLKDLLLRGTGLQISLARAGVCYGSLGRQGDQRGSLITIDPATGIGTLVGQTGLEAVNGLAVNANGVIFGADLGNDIYLIDAATGSAKLAFRTPFFDLEALAFDETGLLYGVASDNLYTFNPSTGASTFVGQAGVRLKGLDFDPISGTLWGSSRSGGIYTVNVETGAATFVGDVQLPGSVPDIHFDSEGNLFGALGGGRTNDNQLISIDKVTAAGSVVGPIGFSAVSGLTFFTQPLQGRHLAVSVSRFDFGVILLDSTSAPRTVLVRSVGTDTLTVSDISTSDPAFVLTGAPSLPKRLAPGQTFQLQMLFAPTDAGSLAGSLTISSDDSDQPSRELQLLGEGFRLNFAEVGVCYAAAGRSGINKGRLLRLDPETGAGALIGQTGLEDLSGLAINAGGVIYAMDRQTRALYFVDAASGRAVLAAPTQQSFNAIAFDHNDVLYGIDTRNLYTIDPKTGDAVEQARINNNFSGMAFDPFDGTLFASPGNSSNRDEIFVINPETGDVKPIGRTGFRVSVLDLHVDAHGTLFGISTPGFGSERNLISLDRLSGEGRIVGPTGFTELSDLAFRPQALTGPHLGISTRSIGFGVVLVDSSSAARPVVLRNVGTAALRLSEISTDLPFRLADLPTLPLELEVGETDTFTVVLEPIDSGVVTGSVTISSNAETPERSIALTGDGFKLTPATAGLCYAANSRSGLDELIVIDTATGTGTAVGQTNINSLIDIDILSGSVIIGLGDRSFHVIDAASGRSEFLASTEFFSLNSMAAGPDDSVFVTRFRSLHKLDPYTGRGRLVGSTSQEFSTLAFDPFDQLLWAARGDDIYRVDPADGNTTLVGPTGLERTVVALHVDNEGILFGVHSGGFSQPDELIVLDRHTGQASLVGEVGFRGITGMAFKTERLPGAQAGISPRSVDFGLVLVDSTSVSRSITILSVGTDTLEISEIAVDDSSFHLKVGQELPLVLTSGGSFTFDVIYEPEAVGLDTGQVVIKSNDAETPNRSISLIGEGFTLTAAQFGICYGSTGTRGSNIGALLRIDQGTGRGTIIGSTGLAGVPALAINSSGIVVAAEARSGDLYYLDAASGRSVPASKTRLTDLDALAFDENDILFGINGRTLYTVDPTTGTSNRIGSTGRVFKGMAFDPLDGQLWAASGSRIYTVDKNTAQPRLIGDIGLNQSMPDIHFDAEGNLYGAMGGGRGIDRLILIDKQTGAGTVVGEIGISPVSGLATRFQRLSGRQLSVNRTRLDFGQVLVDTSAARKAIRTVTLRSFGTDTLTISEIGISEAPFQLVDSLAFPLALARGELLQVSLAFVPTDTGSVEGVLTISSNDEDGPSRQVSLRGQGIRFNRSQPLTWYASTGKQSDSDGSLLTLNAETGAATFIASTGLNQLPGLAISSRGEIVGSDGSDLYYIDSLTGKTVLALHTNLSRLDAIAFDSTDVLYAADETGGLYTMNLRTSEVKRQASLGVALKGLAFDPTDGQLWGSSGSRIYKVNLNTGRALQIGNTSLNANIPDIGFDDIGRLLGVTGGNRSSDNFLVQFNKATGLASIVGEIGFRSVSGLAFAQPASEQPTHVQDLANSGETPLTFTLQQNFPNPFNPSTRIRFAIAEAGRVALRIFNIRGQLVRTLVNEERAAQFYEEVWDGRNDSGLLQASGVYIVQVKSGEKILTRRMTLVK